MEIEKTQNKETGLQLFDSVSFLSNIEKADSLQKKVKIFNAVLNQPPIVSKNMKAELAKAGVNGGSSSDYDYIPVGIVEEALRQLFFRQIDFQIVQSYRDLNTFIVICRLRYKDPISLEYREIDGIGAKSIQQNSGAKIDTFNFTMKANGLELAVGIAYSRAIKNAAKKLGQLFGSSLNRDDEAENIVVFSKKVLAEQPSLNRDEAEKSKRITNFIKNATTLEKLQEVDYSTITDKKIKNLYNAKKRELSKQN